MSSIMTPPLLGSIVKNPVAWSLTNLAVLAAGIASASTPLLIASGVLAFGRPLLYAGMLKLESDVQRTGSVHSSRRLPYERRASPRVGALGVF